MKYHFKVHKEENLWWAEGLEISWAHAQAKSVEDLRKNMEEVLALCLEEPEDSHLILPLPNRGLRGKNVVEVQVAPTTALAMMVRRERLMHKISQRKAAEKLGIKHLSQYQRLESGKTSNPELGTLAKLKKIFPRISLDMALA